MNGRKMLNNAKYPFILQFLHIYRQKISKKTTLNNKNL